MNRLSHRGPDGRDVRVDGHVAMGHWHFWTTPEEVGENQPLELPGFPFVIVLDGRLDNRDGLLEELSLKNHESMLISDAALILFAYDHWGNHCFEHFVGEYAVVIFDKSRGELVCARDALGDRTLFYSILGTRLVIASEPWAIAGADNSPMELDDRAAASYFAMKATEDGQTLFKNIFELLPAHVMIHSSSGFRTWQYWQPDPSIRLRGKSDMEYAEEFRSLLEDSVRCRMRSTTPVGVLMSGGLDSGSIACLAARILAPDQLHTISYVFNELSECDERKYIEMVKDKWNVNSIQIKCDDAWPYKNLEAWPINPNYPDENVYRWLKERAYKRAKEEGLRVLMPGAFGDELYCGEENWLADLIEDKHFSHAARELIRHIKFTGLRATLNSAYLRRAARRLLNLFTIMKINHSTQKFPDWLSPESTNALAKEKVNRNPFIELKSQLFGLQVSHDSSFENINASHHSLELRHPYRDRRLIEYVISLPAYQLYNRGYFKYILRVAMQGILPHPIISRTNPTYLLPLLSRGLTREQSNIENHINNPDAAWRKYVLPKWVFKNWKNEVTPFTDGPSSMVPWLCISFDLWKRKLSLVK